MTGQVLADEIRTDRQLAVATVDEHREAYRARATVGGQRVEGGPDRAARVQHVVDEHDRRTIDPGGREAGRARRAGRIRPQIVAVHRHVEGSDRGTPGCESLEHGGDPLGEQHTTSRDAQKHERRISKV